jgi:hypothetical protein
MLTAELLVPERLVNIYSNGGDGSGYDYKTRGKRRGITTVSFRVEIDAFEKLQQEARNRGISLNSLMNHIVKNYFEWHIFEPKVGFVPILKPVVEEVFTAMSKEQIAQIAANSGKGEFENSIHYMKGRIDLDSFLSWFEARMKNSSIEVSHIYDANSRIHTYVVKHDICLNWSLYLKQVIEYIFNQVLRKKVDVSTSYTTLTFKFKDDDK